MPTPKS
jgi:hypothetical protein